MLLLPSEWQASHQGALSVYTLPETNLRIEAELVSPAPDDRKVWGERTLFRDTPAGGKVEQVDLVDSVGNTGYGCTIVTTKISDANKVAVELRLTFFFEFLYAGGVVVVRIGKDDVERWEKEVRPAVIDAIRNTRPAFQTGEVGHLAEIYDTSQLPSNLRP